MNRRNGNPGTHANAVQQLDAPSALMATLDEMAGYLQQTPLWSPSSALLTKIQATKQELKRLGALGEGALVIAIVGPSGAGKSTLFNALAGSDLAATGLNRPTTRQVQGLVSSANDAAWLIDTLGLASEQIETSPKEILGVSTILVDTPDTNTLPENQAVLTKALEQADLVLAVFDAQNPQLEDNLIFLAPAMRRLPPGSVIPVLNRVDRVAPKALRDEIMPRVAQLLQAVWDHPVERIYAISAREALGDAHHPEDEQPLHELNEFSALQQDLITRLAEGGAAVRQRTGHARHLVSRLRAEMLDAVTENSSQRAAAREQLNALHQRARDALADRIAADLRTGTANPLSAALYEEMTQRWWGPISWLMAVWALVLRAIMWLRPKSGRIGPQLDVGPGDGTNHRQQEALYGVYAAQWPPITDLLVEIGFSDTVRRSELWQSEAEKMVAGLHRRQEELIANVLERFARKLSWWPAQILLNGAVIGLVFYIGIHAMTSLFRGDYLPGDYFRHAAIVVLIVWFTAFALIQMAVSTALGRPLRRSLARTLGQAADSSELAALNDQIKVLDELAAMLERRPQSAP